MALYQMQKVYSLTMLVKKYVKLLPLRSVYCEGLLTKGRNTLGQTGSCTLGPLIPPTTTYC